MLEEHSLVCEMEPILCSFHELGCKEKVLRKDMDNHNETNIHQHLVLRRLVPGQLLQTVL